MNIDLAREIGGLVQERIRCGVDVTIHPATHNATLRLTGQEITLVVLQDNKDGYVIKPALGELVNYQRRGDSVPYLGLNIRPDSPSLRTQLVEAILEVWDASRIYTNTLRERRKKSGKIAVDRRAVLSDLARASGGKVAYERDRPDFWFRNDEVVLSGEIDPAGNVHIYLDVAPDLAVGIIKRLFRKGEE